MEDTDVKKFWNERAWRGSYAGTNDLLIKQLEISKLEEFFSDGKSVFEIGCGNGESALYFGSRFQVSIDAMDFAANMITVAMNAQEQALCLRGQLKFVVGDIRHYETSSRYDLIYCQRALINLGSWEEQEKAIRRILSWLNIGGLFLMCENSSNGLEKINNYRRAVGLTPVEPPWHNKYFLEAEVASIRVPGIVLDRVDSFSSTYYFLSRVVNAALAAEAGKEPNYEDPINHLALKLPAINDCGQTKLWVWRRVE